MSIRDRVQSGTGDEGWTVHADGSLRYRERVVVPQLTDLREEIIREFHCSRFAVHPGGMKMYQDLRHQYYWSEMACVADVGCPILLPPLLYLHGLKPVLSFTLSGKTYTWTTNNIDHRKLIQMLSDVFYLFLVFFIFQFYDLLHSMYYYKYDFLSCTYIMSPFM